MHRVQSASPLVLPFVSISPAIMYVECLGVTTRSLHHANRDGCSIYYHCRMKRCSSPLDVSEQSHRFYRRETFYLITDKVNNEISFIFRPLFYFFLQIWKSFGKCSSPPYFFKNHFIIIDSFCYSRVFRLIEWRQMKWNVPKPRNACCVCVLAALHIHFSLLLLGIYLLSPPIPFKKLNT